MAGDIQYQGGYLEYRGGYLEYYGGYLEYCGGYFEYCGGYLEYHGGYHDTCRDIIITMGGGVFSQPTFSCSVNIRKTDDTCVGDLQYPFIHNDILHGTEHTLQYRHRA